MANKIINKKFKIKIKDLFLSRKFYISLFIFLLGVFLTYISSLFIFKNYPSLPVLPDLILDNIPYFNIPWIYDFAFICLIIFFFSYAFKKEWEKIPYFILLFGIINFVRGIFIILTPIGLPAPITNNIIAGIPLLEYGLYPSGHTAIAFLSFLLIKGRKYKIITLSLTLVIIISLLFARGHYSIDIFSALVFAYAVYCIGEKHFKNKMSLD